MVAPVQGTVGKTSADPATQDYLTELTDFYNKPENDGVESEYTAPDGSKFKIEDASYLSTIRSNVNTGKYDSKAEAQQNAAKTLDKKADMSLDNSEYAKKKQQGTENAQKSSEASKAESKGGSVISQAKSFISDGTKPADNLKAQQAGVESGIEATNAETAKNVEATKATFDQMDQNAKKMKVISQKSLAQTSAAFEKAKSKRAKMADKKAEQASEELSEDSSTQSGNKMGFEGKLMTTASTSSSGSAGDKALDKSWEDSMNGKIKISTKAIQTETPKLKNVKDAGEVAAQPGLQQADAMGKAADGLADAKKDTYIMGGFQIGGSVMSTASGVMSIKGFMAGLPVPAAIVGVAVSTVATLVSVAMGVVNTMMMNKNAGKQQDQIDQSRASAKTSVTQSNVARKNAEAQANASNARLMQANQGLTKLSTELAKGLSAPDGEASAVNISGMDESQLEKVKKERYDKIMAHEQAHAAISGGTPVIETDSNGIVIGGYVQIDVPSLNENDLQGTIDKAQKVIAAALAPSDASSQDQAIASKAKNVLAQAQKKLEEKVQKSKEDDKKDNKENDESKKSETTEIKDTKEVAKEEKKETK